MMDAPQDENEDHRRTQYTKGTSTTLSQQLRIGSIITIIYCMPRFFWILYSKPLGFGFKARGLRDTCHQRLIF
jgi:hypothetical protein